MIDVECSVTCIRQQSFFNNSIVNTRVLSCMYVFPCVIFFLVFFCPFSIAITSLGEERANLSAFRTFVRFMLVCVGFLSSWSLGVWEGLRFVIVALPGLFSYFVFATRSYMRTKIDNQITNYYPVSILYKSIAGRYRPVRVADGPITARYRFIKNASWVWVW